MNSLNENKRIIEHKKIIEDNFTLLELNNVFNSTYGVLNKFMSIQILVPTKDKKMISNGIIILQNGIDIQEKLRFPPLKNGTKVLSKPIDISISLTKGGLTRYKENRIYPSISVNYYGYINSISTDIRIFDKYEDDYLLQESEDIFRRAVDRWSNHILYNIEDNTLEIDLDYIIEVAESTTSLRIRNLGNSGKEFDNYIHKLSDVRINMTLKRYNLIESEVKE